MNWVIGLIVLAVLLFVAYWIEEGGFRYDLWRIDRRHKSKDRQP